MASTGQPPSTTPSGGRREMMFCHECHDEWYRDQHGLQCPECHSDFTEVIEDDNDPRDNVMHGVGPDDDDAGSMPDLEEAPYNMHALHNHNPWQDDDPDEADISAMQFQPTGPGRFHVSATVHRGIPPTAFGQNGNGPNTIGGITSFLTNLLQGPGPRSQNQPQSPPTEGQESTGARAVPDGQPHVHRWTYTSGPRLYPRDGDNPGPRIEPVDDLNSVLSGLFAAFGEPPGGRREGQGHTHAFDDMPMYPFMGLFAAMSGGQHGDAVYSQEALDRIITQLMEQTASSNAPGPAPQDAIDALPKRKISVEMLGAEGRAECSICMDEVDIGEEVTELPCKHWFHPMCVEAWLHEHDTCPHCRQGIAKHDNEGNTAAGGDAPTSGPNPTANTHNPFVAGDGSLNNPFVVPGAFPSSTEPNPNASQSQGRAAEGSTGGSFGDRFRRGWSASRE